ncbi:M1 family metallopeptidase [Tsuneonella mangrovi]|uniref:M1 family metallopeptidase n=1 Tax=Tsuneonella mangrovi TaxID=1982042 RepID=UPI001471DC23|nr:M1 family metallopeptidase [Tsuneonella mangrovi]
MAASAAFAAERPDADLPSRTSESGAPLDATQQAMDLPHLLLAVDVDPQAKTISAVADYTIRAASPLAKFEFDLDPRLAISQVTVDGVVLPAASWSSKEGLVSIDLPKSLATGETAKVAISYGGTPRVAPRPPWIGGFTWAKTEQGKPWISTTDQLEGCDLWWLCLDNPSKRVDTLDLAVTVPEGLVDASNGLLLGSETANGKTTWRWRARKPNNYGISLQIGPYELAEADYQSRFGNTLPVRFWYLPGHKAGAERLVREMETYLDFFESTIGPYPWSNEKVGIVETPHKGMEHQTINAYGNKYELAPEGYDQLMQHEFSHEWFANQLSNKTTADMWLQEGLGTYMQPLYLGWKDGPAAYTAMMWQLRKGIRSKVPLAPREFVSSNLYEDREAGWGGDIYTKGAWVAHTLRHLIGDKAFFTSIRRLVYGRADPRPGNFDLQVASTADFRKIVEQETGRDLGWFFDAYFRTAALPRLEATRTGKTLSLDWKTESKLPFAMPVEVEVGDKTLTVSMANGHGSLELPSADSHVILDPNAKVLRYDPAIAAWQVQEDAKRKAKEAAAKKKAAAAKDVNGQPGTN